MSDTPEEQQEKRFVAKPWEIASAAGKYSWRVVDTETRLILADFYTGNSDPEALARRFAAKLNYEATVEAYAVLLRKLLDEAMAMPPRTVRVDPPLENIEVKFVKDLAEEDDEEDGMAHLAGCPSCYAGHDCHDHAEEGEG